MIYKIVSSFAFLLITIFVASAQQKPFSITGQIDAKSNSYIYLRYAEGDNVILDSSLIANGKFSFKGTLSGPVQATVMMDRSSRFFDKYAQVYLVPADMHLSIDYKTFNDGVVLKGSSVQDEADLLDKWKAPAMAKLKPFSEAYQKANMNYIDARKAKKDQQTLDSLKDVATKAKDATDPFYEELEKVDKSFMDKYPASYVTASMMRYRISGMKLNEAEERYNKLPASIKNSGLGKEIKNEVDALRMGSPGSKAFVFSSKELRGNMLSLADYKGRYVLIDFWASWCVPCRAGNPHLLSLYSKYKNKGFEIIGISDDDSNPDAWKKAVDKDGIGVWKHVLRGLKYDGKDFDRTNDISDHFGIHTLPTKVLVDPNGVIIGRYGGGGENDEAMDIKLKEIFGE